MKNVRSPIMLAACLAIAACGNREAAPSAATASVLDGRAALQPGPLADLAYARSAMGARWLAGVVRDNGAFHYIYDPKKDRYDSDDYNEVRHAGATYSLWQLYGATRQAEGGDEKLRAAAERASGWIGKKSIDLGPRGRAFVHGGRMKLGGQALALVALLERRRVTGDTAHDPLIAGLARFMLTMEMPRAPGRYFQSYDAKARELLPTPPSNFYPGEALLALTRLAQQDFAGGPWLPAARRAARYLIYSKDGDIPAAGKVPREDHWLTIALAELHALHSDDAYRAVTYLQGDAMIANQYDGDHRHPQKIGAARRSPISFTSTATKGEALVAAWALAARTGDDAAAERFARAARRNAQFRMRVQWTPATAGLFPNPARLAGGWGANPADPKIQIDYVQHNISALIGVWHLTRDGRIPVASAGAKRADPVRTAAAVGS